MKEKISNEKAITIWENVLTSALKIPHAKVDRDSFLRKEFSKYYIDESVDEIIKNGYKNIEIDKKIINKIANSSIKKHTLETTTLSVLAGMPGGKWAFGTVPADLTQFFYHTIVIAQKLAYIYGWPSFDKDVPTDEFVYQLTIFIGAMYGIRDAVVVLGKIANGIAEQMARQLSKKTLTKYKFYNLAKQIAKWFGVKLTKEKFARIASKMIPLISGAVSGALTHHFFKKQRFLR